MKRCFKSLLSCFLVLILSFSFNFSFSKDVLANSQEGSPTFAFQSPEIQEELKELDTLAKEYYDYYIENGSFPSNNTSTYAYISSSFQVVTILSGAGISISVGDLAQLAAKMGILAGIDGPLPVGDVCAIMLGVTFIIYSGLDYYKLINLHRNREAVGQAVRETVYSLPATENAKKAITTSKVYADNARIGHKYFACSLNDGSGGGIIIEGPINETVAISRLKRNFANYNSNVFSVSSSLAYDIATKAGHGAAKLNSAHHIFNQPLNLPHYHPTDSRGEQTNSHSFFI